MNSFVYPAGLYVLAFLWGSLPLERLTANRWLRVMLQLFKGAIPTLIAMPWLGELWLPWLSLDPAAVSGTYAWWVILLAILGDTYSPWLRFRGGTGVLPGLGGLFVVSPFAAVAGIVGYFMGGLASPAKPSRDIVPVLAGILAAALAHLVLFPMGPEVWVGAIMVFIFLLRHEDRIDRALQDAAAQ